MAFYTALRQEDIERFLKQYDLPLLRSYEGVVEGSINSTYRLNFRGGEMAILTLYEREVQASRLEHMALWMTSFKESGLPCPVLFRGRDGGVCYALKKSLAVLARSLPGKSLHTIEPVHAGRVGTVVAKMHLVAMEKKQEQENKGAFESMTSSLWSFERLPSYLEACEEILEKKKIFRWKDSCKRVEELLTSLRLNMPRGSGLSRGMIHSDLFPNNVLFQKERISGILDFDFFSQGFFSYDLAICLCAWCFDKKGVYDASRGQALLSAYHQERRLEKEEQEHLAFFSLVACVRFFLGRLLLLCQDIPSSDLPDPMDFMHQISWHQKARFQDYGVL